MGIDIRQTNYPPRDTREALGGLGGQQFKSLGNLSDWHQLWFTSADSSGNRHRLNPSRPSIPQVAFRGGGGGVGCHKFKSLGKLSNGWTDCPKFATHLQIHLGMDILQTNCPSRHKGGTWGGFRGQTLKSLGKLSNGWTDWHQLWFTSADSSGNGHRLNPSRPSIPQGAIMGDGGRGSQIQKSGEAVKQLDRLAPNLVYAGGFVWEWT